MRFRSILYLLVLASLLYRLPALAQGCSDAGFCSIGAMKQRIVARNQVSKITVMAPIGLGDEGVLVLTPSLNYERQLSPKWSVLSKLTVNTASGNLGTVSGPGDVFLSGSYKMIDKHDWNGLVTVGTKIPINNGNLKCGGQPLPMAYQSSLGTLDMLIGLSISNKKWLFSAGGQLPLTGANGNQFLPGSTGRQEALAYSPSNQFTRKPDLLVRAAYQLAVKSRGSVNVGLLGIYHLSSDVYTDAAGIIQRIAGSRGLTLNATLAGWWTIKPALQISLTVARPLITRTARPDGLTRSIVVSPEVSWFF